MIIKKLSKKDFEEFLKFREKIKDYFVGKKNPALSNSPGLFIKKNIIVFIAKDKNKIIGYAFCDVSNKKRVRLKGIVVHKNYQGKGIGEKLIKKVLSELKNLNCKKVVTRTWSSNNKSISLFTKFDFEKYYTIKTQRINGDDTIWLKLEF